MAESAGKAHVDIGLLVLRIGIGAMFIIHGVPKIAAGPDAWTGLGKAMGFFGITYAPEFWGFMSAFSEAVGGLFLVLGVFVRPFAFLMFINMVVATTFHLSAEKHWFDSKVFGIWSHAAELMFVFLALLILGGGKYSLIQIFGGSGKK